MTDAAIGYGVQFKIRTSTGPDVFTTIGEQAGVTPPEENVDSVDASHTVSPGAAREFIPGMLDNGEASIDLNYVPGGTAEATLRGALRVLKRCRVSFPSGAYFDFDAFITSIARETPIDDKMTASITWKLSGEMTGVAASAPTNDIVPAISGVAQVGVPLTVFEGVWSNEPTSFTYQWEAGGTPIAGATAKTYTPIVGQVGSPITCVVTGVNSAGSDSAESAATPNVIAA